MTAYADKRIATVTSAEPAIPNLAWPIGTRLALEGEASAWRLIEVAGAFDNGPEAGGYEAIVRPVAMEAGTDCAPRKVGPDALVALGYVVAEAPDEDAAAAWEAGP